MVTRQCRGPSAGPDRRGNAHSSTRRRVRSAPAGPTDPGDDRLMNGLYSYRNLSVMQQARYATSTLGPPQPSILFQVTPDHAAPATKFGAAEQAPDRPVSAA